MKLKNIISLFSLLILACLAFSCEENNILNDLGTDLGSNVAGVYLEPGADKLQAGTTVTREVRFWSTVDEFDYVGLWEKIDLYTTYKVTVSGAVFRGSELQEIADWQEYEKGNFSFADWVPSERAYVKEINYPISTAYDFVVNNSANTSFSAFKDAVPDGFEADLYSFCTYELSRTALNNIVLSKGTMSQAQFDGLYGDNGFLTSEGRESLITELGNIGVESLVDGNYEIELEYEITLGYRVTNSTGVYNDSRRSFLVF